METPQSIPSSLFDRLSPPTVIAFALALLMLSFFVQELLGSWLSDSVWAITIAGVGCYLLTPALLWTRLGAAPGPRLSMTEDLGTARLLAAESGWLLLLALSMLLPLDRLGELNQWWLQPPAAYTEWQKGLIPSSDLETVALYLGLGVVVPLGEEILFRGMVQQALRRSLGAMSASLAAGTLFGLLHLQPWFLLPLVATGFLLGLVYEITDTLWAPILLHVVYNCAVLTLWLARPEDELPGSPIFLAALAVGGVLVSALALARLANQRDLRLTSRTE